VLLSRSILLSGERILLALWEQISFIERAFLLFSRHSSIFLSSVESFSSPNCNSVWRSLSPSFTVESSMAFAALFIILSDKFMFKCKFFANLSLNLGDPTAFINPRPRFGSFSLDL